MPATLRDTIDHWPFVDMAMNPYATESGYTRATDCAGGLIRVAGIVMTTLGDREESLSLRLNEGHGLSLHIDGIDRVAPYHVLRGLFMEATVECEEVAEGTVYYRAGQLREIHGIEAPNWQYDGTNSLALRGEVTAVERRDFNTDTYGARLRIGEDTEVNVSWNPSRSPILNTEGITQEGSVVLLGVDSFDGSYVWHPNNEDSRRYLVEPPIARTDLV